MFLTLDQFHELREGIVALFERITGKDGDLLFVGESAEINVLSYSPGDILSVNLHRPVSQDQAAKVEASLKDRFPDLRVILTSDAEMKISQKEL
jgi:hypothetical protein